MADINAYVPDDADTSTDYDPISFENKDSYTWGIYMKIRALHYQFNEKKIRYKMIASTWFLAAFIAYDLLLSDQNIGLIINKFFGVFALGVIAALAIILISILDLGVTMRRVEVLRKVCLQLEKDHTFLTKTYHNMEKVLSKKKKSLFEALFYAILVFVLLFISNVAFHIFLVMRATSYVYLYSALIFLTNCAISVFILYFSRKSVSTNT